MLLLLLLLLYKIEKNKIRGEMSNFCTNKIAKIMTIFKQVSWTLLLSWLQELIYYYYINYILINLI